jgi:hypothetical protein
MKFINQTDYKLSDADEKKLTESFKGYHSHKGMEVSLNAVKVTAKFSAPGQLITIVSVAGDPESNGLASGEKLEDFISSGKVVKKGNWYYYENEKYLGKFNILAAING